MLGRVAGMWLRAMLVTLLVLLATACTSGSEDTTTTETLAELTTTVAPETTTTVTTTLAPLADPAFPQYSIAQRIESGNGRDTVVVLLDPDSYDILSDVDLYDILADVVDRFPPIFEAHVVDSPAAAAAVLQEAPTEEELQILSEHYFVRLEEGFRIVYQGPFAELGTGVLGS